MFPSHLTLQQKLLLRAAFFLPAKPDEAQVRGACGAGRGSLTRRCQPAAQDAGRAAPACRLNSWARLPTDGTVCGAGGRARSVKRQRCPPPCRLCAPPQQAKALRAFESAFRDSKHGWSTGVLPQAEDS